MILVENNPARSSHRAGRLTQLQYGEVRTLVIHLTSPILGNTLSDRNSLEIFHAFVDISSNSVRAI